ncbi:Beta-agarase D [Kordia antarctica]|uniref:Beta-agarase D n=1 Tax=Kordia antarctica TaxID=1218801 RepID=A0A7L4ZDZ0_9FLAO|nr:T9SS type A sorting domain-containing protein [Kordia antarctica]QHI34885.1 Beta-agarase D [Kordia antarctica]
MLKKSTFFIVLFAFFQCAFGQNFKYIQIEMFDQTPSFSFVGAPTYYYDAPPGATNYSNDAGLNAILTGNNVNAYDNIESIPQTSVNGFANWTLVVCDNCDNVQLASDLNAYSSVIRNAYPLNDRISYNHMYVSIQDIAIGIPTGTDNGVITTNDAGLNAIFAANNVYFYEQAIPASSQNALLRVYNLMCDCDASMLETQLTAYNTVIEFAERRYIQSQALSTTEVTFSDVNVYPNPVENTLYISKTSAIETLEIYSIQGQMILKKTNQFETIDVSTLKSGLYFLKLTDSTNRSTTFKIVKN